MKPRILIVDDEPDARDLIAVSLKNAGMVPVMAQDGTEAIALARETRPELIVLDVMLPDIDGFEVCRILQRDPQTNTIPVLILTGRSSEMDRVIGLELGARDYVTKPFSPRELTLRIRNILNRGPRSDGYFIEAQAPGLEIDVPTRTVLVERENVDLTSTEFELLVVLARNRGHVQTRAHLLQSVLGNEASEKSRALDAHIYRLQKKLGPAAHYIEVVRGIGYRFSLEKLPTRARSSNGHAGDAPPKMEYAPRSRSDALGSC